MPKYKAAGIKPGHASFDLTAKGIDDVNDNFTEFWAVYPRKANKKAALKVWNRINPDRELITKILADIFRRRCSEQWTKQGGQFVPHASTYLNGERWEDEIGALPLGAFSGLKEFVARGHSDDT